MSIFIPGDTVVQREIEVALDLGSVDVTTDVRLRGNPLKTETARDPAFLEANMKRKNYQMGLDHVIGPNIHPKLTVTDERFAHAMRKRNVIGRFLALLRGSVWNVRLRASTDGIVFMSSNYRPAAVGLPIKAVNIENDVNTNVCGKAVA